MAMQGPARTQKPAARAISRRQGTTRNANRSQATTTIAVNKHSASVPDSVAIANEVRKAFLDYARTLNTKVTSATTVAFDKLVRDNVGPPTMVDRLGQAIPYGQLLLVALLFIWVRDRLRTLKQDLRPSGAGRSNIDSFLESRVAHLERQTSHSRPFPDASDVRDIELLSLRDRQTAIQQQLEKLTTSPSSSPAPSTVPHHRPVQAQAAQLATVTETVKVEMTDQGQLRLSDALTAMAFAEISPKGNAAEVRLNAERFFENTELNIWTHFFYFPDNKATAAMYRTVQPAIVEYGPAGFGRIRSKGRVERTS